MKNNFYVLIFLLLLSNCSSSSSSPSDTANLINIDEDPEWRLPKENYVSAKQPLRLIYPRPDVETNNYVYHRSAHPGEIYEVKIGVAFGAYPYHIEINSKPDSARIGVDFEDVGYLKVIWTPTIADMGNHSFDFMIHDQDLNAINVSWTCTVQTDGHVFVDALNGIDAEGRGTQDKPYNTLPFLISQGHANEICHLKAGNYTLPTDLSMRLGNTGPIAVIGDGMDNTSIDCSNSPEAAKSIFLIQGDGVFTGKFRIHSINTAKENPRYMNLHDLYSRVILYALHFDGSSKGTKGNDNVSCFFMPYDNKQKFMYNIMQSDCRFDNLVYSSNGFSAFDAYRVDGFLCCDNVFGKASSDIGARYVLWVKGDGNRNFTIRGNIWEEPWSGENICSMYLSTSAENYSGNIEICYNRILHNDSAFSKGAAAAITLFGGVGTDDATQLRGPIWSYRNTIVGMVVIKDYAKFPVEFHSENDVIIHDASLEAIPHKIFMRNSNDGAGFLRDPETRSGGITLSCKGYELHQGIAAAVLGSDNKLLGGYRDKWLGKRGAEISR